jgi:hypothetical protein
MLGNDFDPGEAESCRARAGTTEAPRGASIFGLSSGPHRPSPREWKIFSKTQTDYNR